MENPDTEPITQQADCLPIPKDGKGIVIEDSKKALRHDQKTQVVFDGLIDSDDDNMRLSQPYSPLGIYDVAPKIRHFRKKETTQKPRIRIPNPIDNGNPRQTDE